MKKHCKVFKFPEREFLLCLSLFFWQKGFRTESRSSSSLLCSNAGASISEKKVLEQHQRSVGTYMHAHAKGMARGCGGGRGGEGVVGRGGGREGCKLHL